MSVHDFISLFIVVGLSIFGMVVLDVAVRGVWLGVIDAEARRDW